MTTHRALRDFPLSIDGIGRQEICAGDCAAIPPRLLQGLIEEGYVAPNEGDPWAFVPPHVKFSAEEEAALLGEADLPPVTEAQVAEALGDLTDAGQAGDSEGAGDDAPTEAAEKPAEAVKPAPAPKAAPKRKAAPRAKRKA